MLPRLGNFVRSITIIIICLDLEGDVPVSFPDEGKGNEERSKMVLRTSNCLPLALQLKYFFTNHSLWFNNIQYLELDDGQLWHSDVEGSLLGPGRVEPIVWHLPVIMVAVNLVRFPNPLAQEQVSRRT